MNTQETKEPRTQKAIRRPAFLCSFVPWLFQFLFVQDLADFEAGLGLPQATIKRCARLNLAVSSVRFRC